MADTENSSTNDSTSPDSSEENCSTATFKDHDFSKDEEALIIRMYNLVGERWSLIAGRIPGRTAAEIEKYWSSRSSTSQ